ncbi:cysteine desulfurase-like protein [Actinotalea sp. M2MS4P-6]|uniref:cysteine desulfurase-like protein n=1 Tax=Actinotalea sp. M2MS4P-6 TaxID=2983762 RepID=UPI0021E45077|nr:cysteine desulfurase-like protein [Actinotalea sp. M2MS4P-6]MCV2393123.1 cysteine desulfurase-like protein [Actinotalea sp. M2MS4P-6]
MPLDSLDVAALRATFSSLQHGIAHFDAPGGTQTPDAVADAIRDALVHPLANRGRGNLAERNADDIVHACRAALGDLLGVDPGTVVVGRSATSLTFEMSRAISSTWREGDEVVITRLEHDANANPWLIAAERRGATVRWADFDPATGELDVDTVAAQLSDRTVLVAVTAASNLIGTMPDLPAIAERVHEVGALLYVDGVHYTAHELVDVPALGADFYTCSPYKFLGPHCGVVTGRRDLLEGLRPDKLRPATDVVPERFELGTLPYELMAGVTAAVDTLAGMVPGEGTRRERLARSMAAAHAHEDALRGRIEAGIAQLPGVTVRSRAARRTPTLLLTFAGHDAADVTTRLAAAGVNAPSGNFYAYEVSRHLGLGLAGGLRIGLAPYNDDEDVDRLLAALGAALS